MPKGSIGGKEGIIATGGSTNSRGPVFFPDLTSDGRARYLDIDASTSACQERHEIELAPKDTGSS